MTGLPASTPAQPVNVHSSPSVIGLEGGRDVMRKQHRRRQRRDRIVTTLVALIVVAAAAGVGWFGYGYYHAEESNDRIESEQRQAELRRERSGEGIHDAIDQLEENPAWNGPGNPAFGVGDDED